MSNQDVPFDTGLHHLSFALNIQQCDVPELLIRVNDQMIDFDQPVRVTFGEKELFEGPVTRSKATIEKTFNERHDQTAIFSAEIKVAIPADN